MLYESKDLTITDKGELYYNGELVELSAETRHSIADNATTLTGRDKRNFIRQMRAAASREATKRNEDSIRQLRRRLPDAVEFGFMASDAQSRLNGKKLDDGKYLTMLPNKPDPVKGPTVAYIVHYMCEKATASAFIAKEYAQALFDAVRDSNYDPITETGNAWFNFLRTNNTEAFKAEVTPIVDTLKAAMADAKNYLRIADAACGELKYVAQRARSLQNITPTTTNVLTVVAEVAAYAKKDDSLIEEVMMTMAEFVDMGDDLRTRIIPGATKEIDQSTALLKDCKAPYEKAMKEYGEKLNIVKTPVAKK